MFPSPLHSVTHSPLIAVVGSFHGKNGEDVVTVAWDLSGGDKGISGHVNKVGEGYKRSSYELGTITKYHGC